MKNYNIAYSFIGATGLTISGQITIEAGDSNEARNTATQILKEKYNVNVRMQDVYWVKDAKPEPKVIDCTPTWAGILPALLAILESGNAEGKRTAKEELYKMAQAADLYNQHVKEEAQRIKEENDIIMERQTRSIESGSWR